MKRWSNRKIFKTIWFSLVVVFFVWNWTTFQSRNLPKDTFENSELVTVTQSDDFITFQSDAAKSGINVIFFQGGLTDPKAYAPLCKKIAENGFTCHLIKMDCRLPQYDYRKALTLFDSKNKNYVIAGHSQGAKMAAQLVFENPGRFKGLFLMGTSHPRDIDLSNLTIPTIKLYAENDGLASVSEVMENKGKLPKNARLILIEGGNHSQFGYLGKLFMDNSADITLEQQQQETFENLINFLAKLKNGL
ncbi:MAG: alpha/beta family hydrolase [Chryseolinea sp.]